VHDRLDEIGVKYLSAAAGTWPVSHHFNRLVEIADGLFPTTLSSGSYKGPQQIFWQASSRNVANSPTPNFWSLFRVII
jgi:hypothetical protein